MEHKDDVKRSELGTRDGQGQADKDGVKDDTKLKDEEGGHLSSIRFADSTIGSLLLGLGPTGRYFVINMRTSMAKVVVSTSVRSGGTVSCTCANTSRVHLESRVGMVMNLRLLAIGERLRLDTQVVLRLQIIMVVAVSELGVAHGHEFDKEQHKDGHQHNAFNPIVIGDGASQAFISQSLIGRCEKLNSSVHMLHNSKGRVKTYMNKGSGYDDTGAEILGDKEGPIGNANTSVPSSEDGEPGC